MNDMVNAGEIIQIKDRFRVPFSSNMNTISCCSQMLQHNFLSDSSLNGSKKKK